MLNTVSIYADFKIIKFNFFINQFVYLLDLKLLKKATQRLSCLLSKIKKTKNY